MKKFKEIFGLNIDIDAEVKKVIIYKETKKMIIELEGSVTEEEKKGAISELNRLFSYVETNINTLKKKSKFEEIMAMNVDTEKYTEDIQKNIAQSVKEEVTAVPSQLPPRPIQNNENFKYGNGNGRPKKTNLNFVEKIEKEIVDLSKHLREKDNITVAGTVFDTEERETRKGDIIFNFGFYDGSNSITCKVFSKKEDKIASKIKKGSSFVISGTVEKDSFTNETILSPKEMAPFTPKQREDNYKGEKRIELHAHTQMSQMDSALTTKNLIDRAIAFGHKAIAITDHGVVQAYPEAMNYSKGKDIKVLYGIEAYVVDDQSSIVSSSRGQNFSETYVVFDIETTGLSKLENRIIEIGAVKILGEEIIDTYHSFIDPGVPLSEKIKELTGITDNMLVGEPTEDEIIPKFLDFCEDAILVAHNANFDVGFIRNAAERLLSREIHNTVLDTVELARLLLPDIKNHKLNTVAEHLGVSLENHHRAVDDAQATAGILLKCFEMLKEKNINDLTGINALAAQIIDTTKIRDDYHISILVKNQAGLRNLYEMVSLSHISYYYRNKRSPKNSRPRIPKTVLESFREGLIFGTACKQGELYTALIDNKPASDIREIGERYDYFEIQPSSFFPGIPNIEELNKKILKLGDELEKLVVATGNVHYLNPEDDIYRKIILYGEGNSDLIPPQFFRNTEEMMEEFSYLGERVTEVVVENTHKICDMIENVQPVPSGVFAPIIEGSAIELEEITMKRAKELYGEELPEVVEKRLDKELKSIIGNNFSVMYISAQKLVQRSIENKYTVGSRGSVGSSFVATMSGITEVNPLPAHYLCECTYSEFDSKEIIGLLNEIPGASGCDLPTKSCPKCGREMEREGHDIPFETFLGFDGDKEPDIDLNFSGEYQQKAHEHAEELFGTGNVFKAGTISTLADKTAFAYTKKYVEEKALNYSNSEINRIKIGATGVKRTTGQHPGGLMIVPNGHSIYEFTPIQRPANDIKSDVTTTHFDYNAISGRLLKLDLLGHDVPTILNILWETSGKDPTKAPLNDSKVISLFTSPKELGLNEKEFGVPTGSLGLPEFGTNFVRNMLLDTMPSRFGDLVRISGLSHGTDVWANNAKDLIKDKTCTLKDVIATRDDIMVYLIAKGLDPKTSFFITEDVRKGKGLTTEYETLMKEAKIPSWYIESCKKIKYMFPKGHAVAYVMMAVRIAYYKLYEPLSFYTAIFSVKSGDFNYSTMCTGIDNARTELGRMKSIENPTQVDNRSITTLELVLEMYLRGFNFAKMDVYKAHETKFLLIDDAIMPPLSTINGLGESVAIAIVEEREKGEFKTMEDFKERTKANKNTMEILKELKILEGIPETRQLTLF